MRIFLFFVFIIHISCNCRLIECQENGEYIKLKLIKDGQNALFGPNASINPDSIRFFSLNDLQNDEFIAYNDSTKTMNLFLADQREYILKIGNIRTDTISANTVVTSTDKCDCSSYQLIKVTINGQVVCQDGCDEIIEVQL